jgi:hypothetical protein
MDHWLFRTSRTGYISYDTFSIFPMAKATNVLSKKGDNSLAAKGNDTQTNLNIPATRVAKVVPGKDLRGAVG